MQITKWHKGTDKPVRDGVYEREYSYGLTYCKFENGKWYSPSDIIEDANIEDVESEFQNNKRWRGVTKP